MENSYIIGEVHTYMNQLKEKMSIWLNKILPQITDNWWEDLVIPNLSPMQLENINSKGTHELTGLDLAALLRVFSKNWFLIINRTYVNTKVRHYIGSMATIRNDWAHITGEEIAKDKVISDVEIIIELMQTFDATMSETRRMEKFIMDIEDDVEIPDKPVKKGPIISVPPHTNTLALEIKIGSVT